MGQDLQGQTTALPQVQEQGWLSRHFLRSQYQVDEESALCLKRPNVRHERQPEGRRSLPEDVRSMEGLGDARRRRDVEMQNIFANS